MILSADAVCIPLFYNKAGTFRSPGFLFYAAEMQLKENGRWLEDHPQCSKQTGGREMDTGNNTCASFFPEKMRILSGSALKLIAVITMLIDHIGYFIFENTSWANEVLFTVYLPGYSRDISISVLCFMIGRVAFPIYAFLLVEGFYHTHNRRRYGADLLLFALISEPIWNYALTGTLRFPMQNVFFTLFFGVVGMALVERFKGKKVLQALAVVVMMFVSFFFKADYGIYGFLFIMAMYFFRQKPALRAIAGIGCLYIELEEMVSVIFMNMYNGKRGFIKGKAAKYCFYAFYPLHILILTILRYKLFY